MEILEPKDRKMFIRKGILFNFPDTIVKFLLPKRKIKVNTKAVKGEMDSTRSGAEFQEDLHHNHREEESLMDIMEDLNVVRHHYKMARNVLEAEESSSDYEDNMEESDVSDNSLRKDDRE